MSQALTFLADVITWIVNGHPNSQIDDLLPWAYSVARHSSTWLKTPLTIYLRDRHFNGEKQRHDLLRAEPLLRREKAPFQGIFS